MLVPLHPFKKHVYTEIDDEDWEMVKNIKWYASHRRTVTYVVGDITRDGKKTNKVYLHRLITGSTKSDQITDHIDGDGLNNKKSNLRVGTKRQNSHNRRTRSDNTSGINGVYVLDSYQFGYYRNGRRHTVSFKKKEDAETKAKEVGFKGSIYHVTGYTFQWNDEQGKMRTKSSKSLDELMMYREQVMKDIGSTNGVRKQIEV
jgi:hypothetical protein